MPDDDSFLRQKPVNAIKKKVKAAQIKTKVIMTRIQIGQKQVVQDQETIELSLSVKIRISVNLMKLRMALNTCMNVEQGCSGSLERAIKTRKWITMGASKTSWEI